MGRAAEKPQGTVSACLLGVIAEDAVAALFRLRSYWFPLIPVLRVAGCLVDPAKHASLADSANPFLLHVYCICRAMGGHLEICAHVKLETVLRV